MTTKNGQVKITVDEWMAELAALSPAKDDDGLTMAEWAAKLGVSVRVANMRLRLAMDAGILRRGERSFQRLDGRPCTIPVYRIEKPRTQKRNDRS